MILRCKAAWSKPIHDLTNKELVTFLQQKIAVKQILPIAVQRVEAGLDDESEFYDGELKEVVELAIAGNA